MIIVLSGKARSGKDTVAGILKDMFYEDKKTVRVVAYADFLKNILGKCFLLTHEQLYGNAKEQPIEGLKISSALHLEQERFWTPRELLQFIGTDVFRKINPDCWVNVIKSNTLFGSDAANTIITDGRFANEIDWVLEEANGLHIHIERDDRTFVNNPEHISENALPSFKAHDKRICIKNNGTLEDLRNKLSYIWGTRVWQI